MRFILINDNTTDSNKEKNNNKNCTKFTEAPIEYNTATGWVWVRSEKYIFLFTIRIRRLNDLLASFACESKPNVQMEKWKFLRVLEIVYGRARNGLTLNRWDGRPKLELGAKWIWQSNRDGNMFHTCTGLTGWYQLADVDSISERTIRRRNTYELSFGNFVLNHLFGRRQLQYS